MTRHSVYLCGFGTTLSWERVEDRGVEVNEDRIVIEKRPSTVDELILGVTEVFERHDLDYVVVSGYVAVLLGRSRSTEDIDVLIERPSRETAEAVADDLQDAGYWGCAMPLSELYETFADGLPIRIAEDGDRVPNVEAKVVRGDYDRLSLSETVTVVFGDRTLTIVRPELQIAYKLGMSAQRDTEDAQHLYCTLGESLSTEALEGYVRRLGVEDQYDRLKTD